MGKKYTIDSLFDDQDVRVVRSYCKIKKNESDRSNPLVMIAFRRVNTSQNTRSFSSDIEYRYASIAEMDILKIGSVWTGNQGIENDYLDGRLTRVGEFEFDLSNQEIEFLNLHELVDRFSSEEPIGQTRVARLVTLEGTVVYIQSLIIFSFLYAPENKNIRRALINFNLDEVIENFVPAKQRGMNNGKYIVPSGYERSNAVFLAYVGNNQITRNKLSNIRTQVHTGTGFIDVEPYHPSFLKFTAVYQEQDGEVFIHRVSSMETPTDHPLTSIKEIIEGSVREPEIKGPPASNVFDEEDVEIQTSTPPGRGSNKQYIQSGVTVIDRNIVDEEIVKKERPVVPPKEKGAEKPENFSSGSEFSDNDSTGKLDIGSARSNSEESGGDFLEALRELENNSESKLTSFDVLQCSDGEVYEVDKGFFTIPFVDENEAPLGSRKMSWQHYWRKKIKGTNEYVVRYRKIALVRVLFNSKVFYFVEIQPRTNSEKFRGLLFSSSSQQLTCESIEAMQLCIKKYEGKLLKAEACLSGIWGQVKVFKHSKNLSQRLKNVLEELS